MRVRVRGLSVSALLASGALLSAARSATAQGVAERPPYHILRYEEDFGFLADFSGKPDFWDPIKFMPLGARDGFYLSLGGSLRLRYEYYREPIFGLADLDENSFLLIRALAHSDFRLGPHYRVFVQLGSMWEIGQQGLPTPFDVNRLALQQGFFDVQYSIRRKGQLLTRIGRQEMILGSGRLVAVRDGPNFRQSFDQVMVQWDTNAYRLRGFGGSTVRPERGVFDDPSNYDELFWGLYSTFLATSRDHFSLDAYYLGVRRANRVFEDDQGSELRHSLGARFFGVAGFYDYNIEAVFQAGTIGDGSEILAWTVATEGGFSFDVGPLRGRAVLRADVASGDTARGDGRVGTFDPLFPNLNYFSALNLVFPSNFYDVHPRLSFAYQDVALSLGWYAFWRYSVDDAVYDALGQVVVPADVSDARFVGNQLNVELSAFVAAHIELVAYYSRFWAGEVVRDAGGADVDFFGAWLVYLF